MEFILLHGKPGRDLHFSVDTLLQTFVGKKRTKSERASIRTENEQKANIEKTPEKNGATVCETRGRCWIKMKGTVCVPAVGMHRR